MKTLILSLCLCLIASVVYGQGGSTGSYAASSYGSSGSAAAVKSGGSTGASYAVTPVQLADSGGSTGTVGRRTPLRTIRENAQARRESRRASVAVVAVPIQAVPMQSSCTCADCQCQAQQAVPASPVSVAQAKAKAMASRGRLSHAGQLAGSKEGIGFSTRSAQDAIANCCYAGRLQAKDVGVARGRDGWYAVQGY